MVWLFIWHQQRLPDPIVFKLIKDKLLEISKTVKQPEEILSLSFLVLCGWYNTDDTENDKQYISDKELKDLLLLSNEEFRFAILNGIRNLLNEDKKVMQQRLPSFFKYIWPKHKKTQTSQTSALFCEIAFLNSEIYKDLVDIILPFLVTFQRNNFKRNDSINSLYDKELVDLYDEELIGLYPKESLLLYSKILPEDATLWPNDIEAVFNNIIKADEKLKYNSVFRELKRKWNSR